jgi:hypothetical protein
MEDYANYPGATMAMQEDPALADQLTRLIAAEKIDVAIETGTYLGTGSTKLIAGCFSQNAPPKRFVTVEINFVNWCRAKANLRAYPFIDCRWGSSVEIEAAIEFIETDEMLINHQNYQGIYIDFAHDPVGVYTRELRGQLNFSKDVNVTPDSKDFLWEGENLLARLLQVHADHRPLIILDSAGGVGLLEFQILMEIMKDRQFFLLLDDTHHIKHYRSLQYILQSPDFDLIAKSDSWVLASHLRSGGVYI